MSKQEEIDFWPGYVDALMNLVLNLLFLSAIFAIAIFVLGMESSRLRIINSGKLQIAQYHSIKINEKNYKSKVSLIKPHGSEQKAMAALEPVAINKKSTKKNELTFSAPSNILVINVTNDSDEARDSVKNKTTIYNEKDNILAIYYQADIVTIDDSVKDKLGIMFSEKFVRRQKIIIWGEASASSAVSKRLTYLRAMAVRNLLLDMGYSNEKISINIYGGQIGSKGGKIYVLGVE